MLNSSNEDVEPQACLQTWSLWARLLPICEHDCNQSQRKEENHQNTVLPIFILHSWSRRIPWSMVLKVTERSKRLVWENGFTRGYQCVIFILCIGLSWRGLDNRFAQEASEAVVWLSSQQPYPKRKDWKLDPSMTSWREGASPCHSRKAQLPPLSKIFLHYIDPTMYHVPRGFN